MENHANQNRLFVWWVIWASILGGIFAASFGFRSGGRPPEKWAVVGIYASIAPLLLSCGLRWLVLPKQTEFGKGFVVFIVGLAMAEACGFLGTFLGGEYRDQLTVLGVLGVVQWMPLFARRFVQTPASNAHGLRSS
ncbi:MAG TPA: hypothetical protein VHO24_05530 [Opitutaceae bacterium]|nr:hypothetical protein [Opitutaceae bacterium]